MSCDKYSDKLSFYVQNELSKSEQAEIYEHIKTCCSCKMKVDELSALFNGFSQIEDIELPSDFHENLISRAEKELWANNNTKLNYIRFIKYASTAAVFALCIFSAIHLSNFNGTKMGKTMSNSAASSVASNSQQQANSGQAALSGNSKDTDGNTEKSDVSSEKSNRDTMDIKDTKDSFAYQLKDQYGHSLEESEKASENTVPQNSSNIKVSGLQDDVGTKSNLGQEPGSDTQKTGTANTGTITTDVAKTSTVKADTEKNDTLKADKVEAKRSTLVSASPTLIKEARQNVIINTNNTEAAFKTITEQAGKFDAKVTFDDSTEDKTTREETYSVANALTASQITQPDSIIVVEVRKEYLDQFKGLLEESFGKANIQYETDADTSTDIIKLVIRIKQ